MPIKNPIGASQYLGIIEGVDFTDKRQVRVFIDFKREFPGGVFGVPLIGL